MKKRLIPLIALVLMLSLSFSSCSIISDALGAADGTLALSGKYECISGSPKTAVSFALGSVTVSVGSRSMKGSYELEQLDDGTHRVRFDFDGQTLPNCTIRTGNYPISVGEQDGTDYMLIFGERYDKVG